jgi:copper(I)-binding protein
VIGALALAGCGSGQITQTDTQVAAVNGAQANVGDIAIREAQFEYTATKDASAYPRGGNAPLEMSIINSGGTADRLVSASSPVAGSVRVSGVTTIPAGGTLLVEGEPAAAAAPPSESAGPSDSAAPTSEALAPDEEPTGASIVLIGVNQEVRPGLNYPVTLTFQKAGTVTVEVPVDNPTTPRTESKAEPESEPAHG